MKWNTSFAILSRKILLSVYRNILWICYSRKFLFLLFFSFFCYIYSISIRFRNDPIHQSNNIYASRKILDKRDQNSNESASFVFDSKFIEKFLNKSKSFLCKFLQSEKTLFPQTSVIQPVEPYLINTESCRLHDWPLFDQEIVPLFQNYSNRNLDCDQGSVPIMITRLNFTWIKINLPERGAITDSGWNCFAQEIKRTSSNDFYVYGKAYGPLGRLNNFANNLTEAQLANDTNSRWDAVNVTCKQYPNPEVSYSLVVPLVQHYKAKPTTQTHNSTPNPPVNVMLLGVDSISRLNFLRHMNKTRHFLESHNFLPLEGYHKVGENSFPNIVPMFTGNLPEKFYNQSMGTNFTFDDIPLIWKDFQKMGYVTTFVEDMPPYGFFSERGGFRKQPTDYYLRPTNLAIWDELYYTYSCYQVWLEYEIYWDYILDQLEAFRSRGNQSHFTFSHLSTLTHNYFNHPGYTDKPLKLFLESIFLGNYNANTLIVLYSDHGIRFGESVNTTASIHEQRLPFIYIYVPDSLVLNGKNASQLREMLKLNRNRLTSHIDLHATMLHVLYGKVHVSEPYGISLFTEIPSNRTCRQAGIKREYCLCNSYNPIAVDSQVHNISSLVLEHMNQLMVNYGNYCVPLTIDNTYRAFESYDVKLNEHYRIVHFKSNPNDAIIEGMVRLTNSSSRQIVQIENISRLTRYGDQPSCLDGKKLYDIVPFCYCWEVYAKDLAAQK